LGVFVRPSQSSGEPHSGPIYPPGYRPPPPPPAGRRDRAPLIILAVLIPLLVVGIVVLMYAGASRSDGGIRTPSACSLVSRAEVDAYLPGAVANGNGDAYYCSWNSPVGGKREAPGRLSAGVEVLPGDRPSVEDAKNEYGIRRRQADEPGTTITPLNLGDETFMACAAPHGGRPGSCQTYTRVRNVVFSLEFESFPVADARDPASSVRALDAEAVARVRGSGG
jgi:hypothetical protein